MKALWMSESDGNNTVAVAVDACAFVYYLSNGEWKEKSCDLPGMLTGVWALSEKAVFITGYDGIYSFDLEGDDGCSQVVDCHPCSLYDVWGLSADDIYAVGHWENPETERSEALVMHFDGEDWLRIPLDSTKTLSSVWGMEGRLFVASSRDTGPDEGAILEYNGVGWTQVLEDHPYGLRAIHGSSLQNIYAVGVRGTIFHYDGAEWREMDSGTSSTLWDVFVARDDQVFATAGFYGLLKYDGQEWSMDRVGDDYSVDSVVLTQAGELYAAGCVMHDDAYCEGQVFRNTCWKDGQP